MKNIDNHKNVILKKTKALAKKLIIHRSRLINILLTYESLETAQDEIDRSIRMLKATEEEIKFLSVAKANYISSFLPINLPLYSLMLFSVVPSLTTIKEVYVRPPELIRPVFKKIISLLKNYIPGKIKFKYCERSYFLECFVKKSDVIIFTGRYGNALEVQRKIPFKSLFIYNGGGVNPFLVAPSADINLAVSSCIKARCFNSGQDCAGPNAIIVHDSIAHFFIKKLAKGLDSLKIRSDYFGGNIIGLLVKTKNFLELQEFLKKNESKIIYGGSIDFVHKICYPTISISGIIQDNNYTQEFFAPIFNILIYNTNKKLDFYFQNQNYLDYAMYVSVFGNSKYIKKIERHSIVLKNQSILDINQNIFGGYGRKTSYASWGGFIFPRPILISKEIYNYNKILNSKKFNSKIFYG